MAVCNVSLREVCTLLVAHYISYGRSNETFQVYGFMVSLNLLYEEIYLSRSLRYFVLEISNRR